MSADDPSEPPGGAPRSWSPESWSDQPTRREPERREPPRREPSDRPSEGRRRLARTLRSGNPPRGRRVRRTLRHVDPWSVLKLALLFNTAIFMIVCVASALLWGGARASGTLDNLESFITSFGFGNCEGDPNAAVTPSSTTSSSLVSSDASVSQFGNGASTTTEPDSSSETLPERATGSNDDDCPPGEHLVGGFQFEDIRVFEVFAFGGVVLVLASTGATVVMALLFNLMSDLTGGVQVWVVEEEQRPRRGPESGSPRSNPRD
jgi:hypothetical protein